MRTVKGHSMQPQTWGLNCVAAKPAQPVPGIAATFVRLQATCCVWLAFTAAVPS